MRVESNDSAGGIGQLRPHCHPDFRIACARINICKRFGGGSRSAKCIVMMAFFKRELSPIERFESALKDKQAARQKLAERSSATETELAEKRTVAERLAVAGAANAKLERAEAKSRAVDELAKALRTELAELDEQ